LKVATRPGASRLAMTAYPFPVRPTSAALHCFLPLPLPRSGKNDPCDRISRSVSSNGNVFVINVHPLALKVLGKPKGHYDW
ncbi:MAG: hypothetical protein ACXW3P_05010, partial [Rhodospirillales bacterium]